MVEIKLQIDDMLIQTFGQAEVEKALQEYVTKLRLRVAAKEILAELPEIDLSNDEKWQLARQSAWEQYKQNQR